MTTIQLHLFIALFLVMLAALIIAARYIRAIKKAERRDHDFFTVGDLRKVLSKYPDNMPFILFDITTEDPGEANYFLKKEDFEVMDCIVHDDGENDSVIQDGLFLVFENELNPNPIPDLENARGYSWKGVSKNG